MAGKLSNHSAYVLLESSLVIFSLRILVFYTILEFRKTLLTETVLKGTNVTWQRRKIPTTQEVRQPINGQILHISMHPFASPLFF